MTKEYESNAERAARLEREAKARGKKTDSDKTKIVSKKQEAREKKDGSA